MQPDFLPPESDAGTPSPPGVMDILDKLRRLDAEATAREMAVDAEGGASP